MEKKTIGGFIAALRKANGMTQKALADLLHISDKTVSRWERDDGAPDLSLIPIIAEIFGVTCDELLRGERKSPEERADLPEAGECEPASTIKGEKQRQRLLKLTLSQYRTQTYIAIGVSVIGIIVALICNLAFLNAILGFLLGAIFFAASIVCQAVFLNRSLLRVEDAELDTRELSSFKRTVITLAEKSIGVTVAFIGFTFPLILMDAYVGLSADSLLIWGLTGAAISLSVYAVVCYFLNASLIRKGTYALSEKEAAIYYHNHRLQKHCAIILALLLALTFIGHQAATTIWGPMSIMEGTTFNDYESFVAFMEQDIPIWADNDTIFREESAALNPAPAPDDFIENDLSREEELGGATYYDEDGNEITEEEALHHTLKDKNGNVVCEYTERNETVISMRYSAKDGTVLPITVCTQKDFREAKDKAAVRHVIFGWVYAIEVIGILLIYLKKRAR